MISLNADRLEARAALYWLQASDPPSDDLHVRSFAQQADNAPRCECSVN